MMSDKAFAEAKTAVDNLLLNVTLLWRRFRRGQITFTPEGVEFYEQQLLEARFALASIQAEYDERQRTHIDLIDRIAGVLRRNLPKTVSAADLIALGEIHDALLAVNVARGISAAAASRETVPVYQPEENRPTEHLPDMAVPPRAAAQRDVPGNVVLFTGIHHERPQGGAA